jgi:hypothetical protein
VHAERRELSQLTTAEMYVASVVGGMQLVSSVSVRLKSVDRLILLSRLMGITPSSKETGRSLLSAMKSAMI